MMIEYASDIWCTTCLSDYLAVNEDGLIITRCYVAWIWCSTCLSDCLAVNEDLLIITRCYLAMRHLGICFRSLRWCFLFSSSWNNFAFSLLVWRLGGVCSSFHLHVCVRSPCTPSKTCSAFWEKRFLWCFVQRLVIVLTIIFDCSIRTIDVDVHFLLKLNTIYSMWQF